MRPNDVLYLPKGVVHTATAGDALSVHITISLKRTGLRWGDLFSAACMPMLFFVFFGFFLADAVDHHHHPEDEQRRGPPVRELAPRDSEGSIGQVLLCCEAAGRRVEGEHR